MHKCGTCSLVVPCLFLGATASLRAGDELPSKVLKPSGGVESISVNADGRWLVAGCKEDTRLWDLKAAKPGQDASLVGPPAKLASARTSPADDHDAWGMEPASHLMTICYKASRAVTA
jgi:hypothetical protein